MGTNIAWTNITLNYFKSAEIKIFPCIDRDPAYDKESRLNTERNFTKLSSNGFGSRTSYIKNWHTLETYNNTEILRCNIYGYDIEIDTTNYNNLLEANKASYLVLKLERTTIASELTGNTTFTYKIGNQDSNNSTTFLDYLRSDNNAYFTGLGYFKTDLDSDISELEVTLEKNPSATELYYLLLIGKDGHKTTESFLPEINTLENGGIKITDLQIGNNNTAWLSEHIKAKYGIKLTQSDTDDIANYILLQPELDSYGINSIDNFSIGLQDALPVKLYKKNDGTLALGVPLAQNRKIKILDENNKSTEYPSNAKQIVLKSSSTAEIELKTSETDETAAYLTVNTSTNKPTFTEGTLISSGYNSQGNKRSSLDLYVPYATADIAGVGKSIPSTSASEDILIPTNVAARNYSVKINPDHNLYVTVPWIDKTVEIEALNNSINNLQAQVVALSEQIENIEEVYVPYETEPYIRLTYNGNEIESTEIIEAESLDNYGIKIYHNMKSEIATVNINIAFSSGKIEAEFGRDAVGYNAYSFIDLGVSKNTLINDRIVVTLSYRDGYGLEKGNYGMNLPFSYKITEKEIVNPFTDTPTIELRNTDDIDNAHIYIQTNVNESAGFSSEVSGSNTGIEFYNDGKGEITNVIKPIGSEQIIDNGDGSYFIPLNYFESEIPYGKYDVTIYTQINYYSADAEDDPIATETIYTSEINLRLKEYIPAESLYTGEPKATLYGIPDRYNNETEKDVGTGVGNFEIKFQTGEIIKIQGGGSGEYSYSLKRGVQPWGLTKLKVIPMPSDISFVSSICLHLSGSNNKLDGSYSSSEQCWVIDKIGNFLASEGVVNTTEDGETLNITLNLEIVYQHNSSDAVAENTYIISLDFCDPADGWSVD